MAVGNAKASHPDTFLKQTIQVPEEKLLGITASISPRHLGTTNCSLTNHFLSLQLMMSDFTLLSTDSTLWDPMTQVGCGTHEFWPFLSNVHVQVITQTQLDSLSSARPWGNAAKPCWDMAFLLIVPTVTTKQERIFALVAVCVHPCQAWYHSLSEAAHKLMLLTNDSTDWAYTFAWLNEGLLHAPLSSEGHISTMIDGMPSVVAHG